MSNALDIDEEIGDSNEAENLDKEKVKSKSDTMGESGFSFINGVKQWLFGDDNDDSGGDDDNNNISYQVNTEDSGWDDVRVGGYRARDISFGRFANLARRYNNLTKNKFVSCEPKVNNIGVYIHVKIPLSSSVINPAHEKVELEFDMKSMLDYVNAVILDNLDFKNTINSDRGHTTIEMVRPSNVMTKNIDISHDSNHNSKNNIKIANQKKTKPEIVEVSSDPHKRLDVSEGNSLLKYSIISVRCTESFFFILVSSQKKYPYI